MEGFNVNKVEMLENCKILNIKKTSAKELFSSLKALNILFGVYSFGEKNSLEDARLVLDEEETKKAEEILFPLFREGAFIEDNITVITVKGMGLSHNDFVLLAIYEFLYDYAIDIKLLSKGETRIFVAVDKARGEEAYKAISKGLYGM